MNCGKCKKSLNNTCENCLWKRALDGFLPEENQKVIYYFECVGTHVGYYKKGTYPIGIIDENKEVSCDIFGGESGFLTDEDVYWMPWSIENEKLFL